MINLEKLENEIKLRGFSNLTTKAYLRHNRAFLKFINKNAEEVNNEDIKNYISTLTNKNIKPSSLSLVISALKCYYYDVLKKTILNDVKIPKYEKQVEEMLTKEEVNKIISSIRNPKHKLVVSFMYASGLKVSEVVKLKINDLDFKNKIGRITTEKNKRERVFILSENVLKDVEDYLRNRNKESEFLFPTKYGCMSIRSAQKIVDKAAKRAKLEKKVHCHLLRASCAKHMLESGINKKIINTLLGNYSLGVKSNKALKDGLKNIKSPFDELSSKETSEKTKDI